MWMAECLTQHDLCPFSDADDRLFLLHPKLPKRLIDVTDPRTPFLKETTAEMSVISTRYSTLSYCWGTGNRVLTVEATYSDFKQKLPLESLPKTFREAIAVTHALKIPYLGIDAL